MVFDAPGSSSGCGSPSFIEQLRLSKCQLAALTEDVVELLCQMEDADCVAVGQLVVEGYEPRYEIRIMDFATLYK